MSEAPLYVAAARARAGVADTNLPHAKWKKKKRKSVKVDVSSTIKFFSIIMDITVWSTYLRRPRNVLHNLKRGPRNLLHTPELGGGGAGAGAGRGREPTPELQGYLAHQKQAPPLGPA